MEDMKVCALICSLFIAKMLRFLDNGSISLCDHVHPFVGAPTSTAAAVTSSSTTSVQTSSSLVVASSSGSVSLLLVALWYLRFYFILFLSHKILLLTLLYF